MEEYLYNAINTYFKTLAATGAIKKSDKHKLFIFSTIYSIYNLFSGVITKAEAEKINNYIRCLADKSCLFAQTIPAYSSVAVSDSLITIVDDDIITTTEGNTVVSTARQTQDFTDFSVRTDIQPDQYLVGYDESDNTEVAINVQDIGIFWEY